MRESLKKCLLSKKLKAIMTMKKFLALNHTLIRGKAPSYNITVKLCLFTNYYVVISIADYLSTNLVAE